MKVRHAGKYGKSKLISMTASLFADGGGSFSSGTVGTRHYRAKPAGVLGFLLLKRFRF